MKQLEIIKSRIEEKKSITIDYVHELKISSEMFVKIENDEKLKYCRYSFYIGHIRSYSNFLKFRIQMN